MMFTGGEESCQSPILLSLITAVQPASHFSLRSSWIFTFGLGLLLHPPAAPDHGVRHVSAARLPVTAEILYAF